MSRAPLRWCGVGVRVAVGGSVGGARPAVLGSCAGWLSWVGPGWVLGLAVLGLAGAVDIEFMRLCIPIHVVVFPNHMVVFPIHVVGFLFTWYVFYSGGANLELPPRVSNSGAM